MSSAIPAEALWFLGTLAIVRVPGEQVGDRFSLTEFVLPRGASPPLHTHPQDESYIVLDGDMTVQAGDERADLEAGSVFVARMGAAHSFYVRSETARVLILSTPAGIERFVRDGSVPAEAAVLPPADAPRPGPEELARVFAEHACVVVGPPLGG